MSQRRVALIGGGTVTVIAGAIVALAPMINSLVQETMQHDKDAALMKECICELYEEMDVRIRDLDRLCIYGPVEESRE